MVLDDPDYYMSLMFDLQDGDKLNSLAIEDLQTFLKRRLSIYKRSSFLSVAGGGSGDKAEISVYIFCDIL